MTLPEFAGRRHREFILTLESEAGELLGGANFLAIQLNDRSEPPVSVALNYVFVERAARGRGLLHVLVAAVGRVSKRALLGSDAAAIAPAIFIEQNDPLRLSAEDYATDTLHSGLDQLDRLALWGRMGARIVDFPYVQPALSSQQAPDDGLLYAALAFPGDNVPAAYLHDHLQSFFGVSVLKGKPLADDVAASTQLAALATRPDPVGLLALPPAIARLRSAARATAGANFRLFAGGREEA